MHTLEHYLCRCISKATELPEHTLKAETLFEDIGLESMAIMAFNRLVEADFPGLPKTLLFDCRSCADVAAYLRRERADQVASLEQPSQTAPEAPAETSLQAAAASDWQLLKPLEKSSATSADEDIAVVGMAGRFPGADDADAFWQQLSDGYDAISEIPAERWALESFFEADSSARLSGKSYAKWGGFLEDVDRFDAAFFNIAPREAQVMDPQERLFLECSWAAFEDAGLSGERLDAQTGSSQGHEVGVFVGVTTNSYPLLGPELWRNGETAVPTAMPWSVANRVSYAMNLCGPSFAVDTACSSSLTALHLACDSLRRGECRAALAGGVNLYLHPSKYVQLCQQQMLSPSGRCHSFGDQADGFVPGEGVGAVVLKTLSAAQRDGDRILGVIRASGLNHGGRANGYTVPTPAAQSALVRDTVQRAGIDPADIGYVEAHGTGTRLGDPIEVEGLTQAYGLKPGEARCAIGSVKSNIGHLESAAGIAGLIKILQQLRHKRLAPSLHAGTLNQAIDFSQTPFQVQTEAAAWPQPSSGRLRTAALSSFGAGGANAHVLISEAETSAAKADGGQAETLFVLSAKNAAALREQMQRLHTWLSQQTLDAEQLKALAYTLQCGRQAFEFRWAAVAADQQALQTALAEALRNEAVPQRVVSETQEAANPQGMTADELCRAWLDGRLPAWSPLWAIPPQPLSAPTYAFVDERHWVPLTEQTASPKAEGFAMQSVGEGRHRLALDAQAFYLRDHVVDGKPVFPAAAYLALCQRAAQESGLGEQLELSGLLWAQPVSDQVAIELQFTGQDARGRHSLVVDSADDQGGRRSHLRGKIGALSKPAAQVLQPDAPFENVDGLYRRFKAMGLNYGPSFQTIEGVQRNGDVLRVSLRQNSQENGFYLHPALLDGVFQSALLAMGDELPEQGIPFVPFGLDACRIYAPLQDGAVVQVRRQADKGDGMYRFDFAVFKADGECVLEIESFAFRALQAPAPAVEAHSFEPFWQAAPLGAARGPQRLLLIDQDDERYQALKALIVDQDLPIDLWLACPGERFHYHDERIVELDRDDPEQFELLWRLLAGYEALPDSVLYAWPLATDSIDAAMIHHPQVDACRRLLRALLQQQSAPALNWHYLYKRGHNDQAHQAVSGLFKSLHLELPSFHAGIIGLENDDAAVLLEEALAAQAGVNSLRREQGERLCQALKTVDITPQAAPWRAGGVYLITGGMGALGLALAERIARHKGTRIALVGRSALDEAKQARLQALGTNGAEAVYFQADLATRDAVDTLLTSVRRGFGAIHGIFHAAGVLQDAFFSKHSDEQWRDTLNAKAAAALWLDELSADDPLDCFMYFSSLAGSYGNVGQSVYAYANALLDQLAERRNQAVAAGHRQGNSISIAWPLWQSEHGMSAPQYVLDWLADNGLSLLPQNTGMDLLEHAVHLPQSRLVVLSGERRAAMKILGVQESPNPGHPPINTAKELAAETASQLWTPTDSGSEKTAVHHAPSDIQPILLDHAKALLAKVTGADTARIDPQAPLEALGLDSIMVMDLNVALEKDFQDLPKTLFFEVRTLQDLITFLCESHQAEAVALAQRLAPSLWTATDSPESNSGHPPIAVEESVAVQDLETAVGPSENDGCPQTQKVGVHDSKGMDIAIVGVAGRYPQAEDLSAFWQNLCEGRDSIVEIPGRWDEAAYAKDGKPMYARWGSFVDDVDCFDPLFFGISPRDAERMDPQERLFLQCAWQTLEDGGYTPESLSRDADGKRRRVAVIAGVMYGEYQFYGAAGNSVLSNSSYASIANRVSYCLNLDGPSFAVDSMCSSSLTSIHLASELIRSGVCDSALAGGVNLSVHPYKYRTLCELQFAASDGRCRSFGEGGDGYVPGEGVGTVLLRRLEDAVADGDHIYAVIRGSDIAHGGKASGYTVPNPDAQAEVIRGAFERAGIAPQRVNYVEAHGTGTSLGDPIEIRGLVKAIGEAMPDGRHCAIGSVKSNIGHLESAAGMAALSKVLLQMRHGELAPSIHAETLNPNIDFEATPFRVQRERAAWPALLDEQGRALPRVAAVSSFGAGGSNAHLLVEEYPLADSATAEVANEWFVFSARTVVQLKALAQRFVDLLAQDGVITAHKQLRLGGIAYGLRDVAATLREGRVAQRMRLAVLAADFPALLARLKAWLADGEGDWLFADTDQVIPQDEPVEGFEQAVAAWVNGELRHWQQCRNCPSLRQARKVPLPTYVFQKKRCWVADEPAEATKPVPITAPRKAAQIAPIKPEPQKEKSMSKASRKVGIIGGGASGLGVAKSLVEAGIDFEIIEATGRFGGNWQPDGPSSKMYDSVHLISSKRNTQFSDFPMPEHYPHYPRHNLVFDYLCSLAGHFKLEDKTRFNTKVADMQPEGGGWRLQFENGESAWYDSIVVCNGLLGRPLIPDYEGEFSGESLHASEYRSAEQLRGKRVLVIGAGNSGCDIAVDAATHAKAAYHSTRRGYFYMPKFINGRPTQEWLMEEGPKFDTPEAYWAHVRATFKLAGYDGEDFGLPTPDHAIEEAHPIMNSQILYHIGHGDVAPKPDVIRFDGNTVHFSDGTQAEIDTVVWATGYDIHLPFLKPEVFDWQNNFSELFLRMVPQQHDNLLFVGYLNTPSGLGNVANVAGRFAAAYLQARIHNSESWQRFQGIKTQGERLDIGQGRFMDTSRHRFEVDLWKFIKALNFVTGKLRSPKPAPAAEHAAAL